MLSWLSSNNNCTLTLPNANNVFLWFFVLWPSMLFCSCFCFSLSKILGSTNHVNLVMFCNLCKLSHISVDTMECTCSNEFPRMDIYHLQKANSKHYVKRNTSYFTNTNFAVEGLSPPHRHKRFPCIFA